MLQYTQNSSSLNIEGRHNEGQQVRIMGNMNEISIGDSNFIFQLYGNGNTVNIIHSALKINILGNGNVCNSIESRLQLSIQGNANSFRSQMQMQPVQVLNCQGFGNEFPQNAIVRSLNGQNNMKVVRTNQSNQFNQLNSFNQQKTINQVPSKSYNNNSNNSNNLIYKSKQPSFVNSLNTVKNLADNYRNLGHMSDQSQEQEYQRNMIYKPLMRAGQEMARVQRDARFQEQRAQQESRRAIQQAKRVQQVAMRNQLQQERINIRRQQQQQQQMRNMFQEKRMPPQRRNHEELLFQQYPPVRPHQYFSSYQQPRPYREGRNNQIEQKIEKKQFPDHGLTETELQRLRTHYHSGPQHQCTICYIEIVANDQAMFLHCFHSFHSKCIKSWMKKSSKCPICNQNVRKNL